MTAAPIQLDPAFESVWDELRYRGSVHVSTDEAALSEVLTGEPITFYCGFDPTAPSLHIGNLAQLIVMRRLQLAGHKPLGLVGGSTGLIGDPKPTAERQLNTRETVAEWVRYLQSQVSRFLATDGPNPMRLAVGKTEVPGLSRITVVVDVEELPLEQVTKQLNKLVNVVKIVELEPQQSVQREHLLIKVRVDNTTRSQILEATTLFRARVVDVTTDSLVIEVTGDSPKCQALLRMLEPYGVKEIAQSGLLAIGRGGKSISERALRPER